MKTIYKFAFIISASLLFTGQVIAAGYVGPSFGSTLIGEESYEDDSGQKLTVGVNLAKQFSFEFALVSLGEFEREISGSNYRNISLDVTGFEFGGSGMLPISQRLAVFGRLGIFVWDADVKRERIGFAKGVSNDDGTSPFGGLGAKYGISERVDLKAEWTYYDVADVQIEFLSIGLVVNFR